MELSGFPTMSDDGVCTSNTENTLEGAFCGLHNCSIELFNGGVTTRSEAEVDKGAVWSGHADGHAVQLSNQGWVDQANGCCSTGTGRDHVDGCCARTTELATGVWSIQKVLVHGVGVYSGHRSVFDADRFVQDLGKWCQAVCGARRVADDCLTRLKLMVVHSDDVGAINVLARSGDDDLLGAGIDVSPGLVAVSEGAGAFEDDVHVAFGPRQVGWVSLRGGWDDFAVNENAAVNGLCVFPDSVDRVVAQQVCKHVV